MAKKFNTAVTCNPDIHYMVDVTNKMKVFEGLINDKCYFTITQARQFGKSTSLNWILHNMSDRYLVIPASFETTSDENWVNVKTFFDFFCTNMIDVFSKGMTANETYRKFWTNAKKIKKPDFKRFASKITEFCQLVPQKVVLTIDEVDKCLDNQLFVYFLSMMRNLYLDREKYHDDTLTFWSVVLAGVSDVKNLKLKIRPEEQHQYNSPWNVAADYDLDMTFNPQEISTMLADYENDYHFGFNIQEISEEIYKYTSGYPVLVSQVCKEIDENLGKVWTKDGVLKAVKKIIEEKKVLSDDLTKNLDIYPKLKAFLRALLLEDFSITFTVNNPTLDLANMFSIIKRGKDGKVEIHNIIFQQVLYNYFISENTLNRIAKDKGSGIYIDKNGDLNMQIVIERFAQTVKKFRNDEKFLEEQGRLIFLCFLKPIINGSGFYYVEPENDDSSRMDIIVNYHGKEYVIELKLWYGIEYEISGRDQIARYITARNLSEGYLVTFSFLKNKVVQEQPEWIEHDGKRIFEAVI